MDTINYKDICRFLDYSNSSVFKSQLEANGIKTDELGNYSRADVGLICTEWKNKERISAEIKAKADLLRLALQARPQHPISDLIHQINTGKITMENLHLNGQDPSTVISGYNENNVIANENNEPDTLVNPVNNEDNDNNEGSNDDNEKAVPVITKTPAPIGEANPAKEELATKGFYWWFQAISYGMVLMYIILIQAFYFAVVEHHYSIAQLSSIEGVKIGEGTTFWISFCVGLAFELTVQLLAFSAGTKQVKIKKLVGYKFAEEQVTRINGSFWLLITLSVYGFLINLFFYNLTDELEFREYVLSLAKPLAIVAFGHLFAGLFKKEN